VTACLQYRTQIRANQKLILDGQNKHLDQQEERQFCSSLGLFYATFAYRQRLCRHVAKASKIVQGHFDGPRAMILNPRATKERSTLGFAGRAIVESGRSFFSCSETLTDET